MKLSLEDRARIHAAVAKAQSETNARIAAVTLTASDRYRLYPIVWGAAAALMTGITLALFLPHIGLRFGVTIEAIVFGFAGLIFEWFPIRMAVAPARVKRDHARALAHREFAARILSPHDGRDGILFFVSLGERYVEIVATAAVHKHAGDETWDAAVDTFMQTAARGRIADGAVTCIEACAALLAKHFPK